MAFGDDVRRAAAERKARLELIARKIVLDVGTRLVLRSPVGDATLWQNPPPPGYAGGRFRGNWQYGFATIPAGEVDAIDASGSATVAAIARGVEQSPAAGIHYIANNLPYAERLENGWSKQAPQGMVALTRMEFEQVVANVASIR